MKKKLRILLAVPVLFLVAVLAIAGFRARGDSLSDQSGGSGSASRASQGEVSPAQASDLTGTGDGAPDSTPDSTTDSTTASNGTIGKQAVAVEPMTRAVISTGQVTVQSTSINRARAELMQLVSSWGGSIADEQTSSDDRGRVTESTMTLRVPTAKFSQAMAAFSGLGTVEQQSRKSEDVTTQVIDNGVRVRAAERSIAQIENLLGRAKELSDIIAIESDLARRQADLDSLKAQQAYLADQTSLSTINVFLSNSGRVAPEPEEAQGFLAGLDGGWNAMKTATVVLLTIIGAVLPFALVLLLLGVPLWLVVRRRLGRHPVSAGSAPARTA